MAEFFHVSRLPIPDITSFELKPIDHEYWYVEAPGKFTKEEYTQSLSNLFPNGTTRHGESYLLSRWPSFNDASGIAYLGNNSCVEAIFEMVRMCKFPDTLSRFRAVFGCKSLEDARALRSTTFKGEGTIYKVECENFIEADMNLLQTGHFFTSAMVLANKYWSGEKSASPFIEILMKPPVEIIGIVE